MGRSHGDYTASAAKWHSRYKVADEIWAINAMGHVVHHDKLFVMDDLRVFVKRMEKEGTPWYTDWMKTHDKPIITSVDYPEFPTSEPYPLERVVNELHNPHYLNSTVAYALALAIADGFKKIILFGCDFTYPNYHLMEQGRGCVEFLLGIAHASGIEIEVAQTSTLMDNSVPRSHKLYGYIKQPKVEFSGERYQVIPQGGVEYQEINDIDFEHGRFVLK
jgi:hypothetical protein